MIKFFKDTIEASSFIETDVIQSNGFGTISFYKDDTIKLNEMIEQDGIKFYSNGSIGYNNFIEKEVE